MKKSLIYIPLVALALASCDRTQDLIFDGSAAERLEQGKKDAIATLTADGGLWAMEYFANSDEHGYVMLTRFSKDGSVEVSVNHEWQANPYQFSQATSLWDIVSDNGTVLSFCTENPLFHVFSDPENITGPYAPTNPDLNTDIDETGYGHEGDYEFLVMTSEDPNTVRLLGKKRGFNIYLRKLPADTDEKAYLEAVKARADGLFTTKFPKLHFTDKRTGEVFVAHGSNGIMNVYALEGDSITQAREKAYITTLDGIRFNNPFSVLRANGSEYEISEFTFTEDGGLESDNAYFSAPFTSPEEVLMVKSYVWEIDIESVDKSLKELFASFISNHDAQYKKYKFRSLTLSYNVQTNSYVFSINEGGSSTTPMFNAASYVDEAGMHFAISIKDANTNAKSRYNKIEELPQIIDMLNNHVFKVSYVSGELNPGEICLTSSTDTSVNFHMMLQ